MTFEEAIVYIKSLDIYGSVLGLGNMRALAAELDNPEAGLRFVHVTGTNGKGSVCAFLSEILIEAGYRVGSYNSPAVLSEIDQFRIDMNIISEELYAEAVTLVKDAAFRVKENTGIHPTRFEVETMVAFVAFYLEKCDIVILETGLGGRDDATNIIENTLLHIITSISLDHCSVLGNTIAEIAANKAGIIKTSAPVLMYGGKSTENCIGDALSVISERCADTGSSLITVLDEMVSDIRRTDRKLVFSIPEAGLYNLKTGMTGVYQPVNALLAVYAARILSEIGYVINEENIRKGLKNTKIPFRFERMAYKGVDIILDGAHNPDGARQLVESINFNYPDSNLVYITGVFKDKDYEEIARITGGMAGKVFAVENAFSERALDKTVLAEVLNKYNSDVECAESVGEALDEAVKYVRKQRLVNPVIICFGSLSWLRYARDYITHPGERKVDIEKIREGVNLILEGIGEDVTREGLIDTPDRVVRMYEEIFSGINKNAKEELSRTFTSDAKDMVIEKDITFYSMCEHHLMPFYGKAHIAYIPNGKVVGISKLARCVEVYAKKPQIQERLTEEIADAIMEYLSPKGVMVMLEAEHMCMTMRGVKKPGTKTVTVSAKGKMRKKENRELFFNLLGTRKEML